MPPHVAAAVATALEKLPADRFASATEFARALRTPTYARSGLGGAAAADRPRSRTAFALPAVTAVLFLTAVAGWLRPRAGDQPDLPVIRSTITLPDSAPITVVGEAPFGVGHAAVVLSPDDEHLVYVAETGGRARLYRRRLDEFDVHPLPGTEGAYEPFFSPDGAWVGFLSTNRLRKVPIAGGAVVDLATAPNTFGATWGDDGRIYFAPNEGRTISWVAEDGGEVRDLTRATSAQIVIGWPQKVQGEPWLVAMPLAGETVAVSTETGEQVTLGQRLPHPRVAGSSLLYTEQTTVMAMPFDPARAAVTGSAVPVLSGVRTEAVFRVGQYAVSPAGTLVYLPGSSGDVGELTWVPPSGAVEMLPYPAQRFSALELAPGGDRLAIVERDVQDHIWLYDFPRAERRRLSTAGTNMSPIWTPDGSRVTWASVEGAEYRIVQRTAAGGVEPEVLYASERAILPSSWSPDGRVLLAFEFSAKGGYPDYDIVVLSPEDGTVEPFVDDPYNTWSPSFSPDGRFVAYTSDESGEYEVWVEPFPRTGERWQVSTGGGNEEPIWSHRGDRLYFRGGTRWYGTAVSWTGGFGFETPMEVFRGPYMNAPGFSYDVRPDGAALVLRDAGQRRATALTLVTNWLATITAEAGG